MPITGYLFNAFGESNNRWLFVIHFLFAVIFACFFTEIKEVVFLYSNEIVILSKRIFAIVGYVLVLTNISFNLYYCFSYRGANWKEEFIPTEYVGKYTENPCADSKAIIYDKSLYRISTDSLTQINGRPENVAMLNNYYGLSYWFSIINGNTQNYVDALNEKTMNWRSFGFDQNIYTEALAACKYYLASDRTDRDTKGYVFIESINFNGDIWYVYMNPYYMGMAYLCENEVKEYQQGELSLEQYNMELWEKSSSKEVTKTSYDNAKNVFVCDVITDDDKNLIIALPYSDKWEIYVDGEKTIPKKFNMYLSVPMERGDHHVVMRYSCKDNVINGIVSLLCMGGLLGIYVCGKRKAM